MHLLLGHTDIINSFSAICTFKENQLMTIPDPPDEDAFNGTGEDNLCESSDFITLNKIQ